MTSGADRGQTNLDFIVGIVVFLVGLSFVLGAVPGFLAPYDDQEEPLVAQRVTATVADSLLAASSDPGRLDVTCTEAFFAGSGGAGCTFDATDSLDERVGVSPWYQLNVTLTWNVSGGPDREFLCVSGGTVGPCGSGGTRLATGPDVPRGSQSVAADRRLVVVGDQRAILDVRVW